MTKTIAFLCLGYVMSPLWSMAVISVGKQPDGEEKTLTGDMQTSPPHAAPKNQQLCGPQSALPTPEATPPAAEAQATNRTLPPHGPFSLVSPFLQKVPWWWSGSHLAQVTKVIGGAKVVPLVCLTSLPSQSRVLFPTRLTGSTWWSRGES